jgi:hypothetical protein
MIGAPVWRGEVTHCSGDSLLQAEWTLLSEDRHVVAQGSAPGGTSFVFLSDYLLKYIGNFKGEPGKTYTLEVKFTKDGSPLNVCDPQLIVMRAGAFD